MARTVIGAVVAVVLVIAGYAVWQVARLGFGIQRSDILEGKATGEEMNILLMGLDSRLDMNGKPLSPELYEALQAGDATDGGLNANVLMYVHIPADGSRAVAFSIPRDDYVDLAGCPDGVCKGKIKTAYGLAFDQENRRLVNQAGLSAEDRHKQSRDAARKAQIATVEKFLDVSIDHFVEVTMVAFFEIAQVVQPITVCVKEDTVDTYSGADFKAGEQQINAQQAVSFVRQRRDTSNSKLLFTDLDRSRRQQAFIVSLLTQLKQSSTLTNPVKINGIVDVAQRNTAIDSGLDPITLAKTANTLQGGNLSFFTLPVASFDNVDGQDVNVVDLAAIRATVKEQLNPPTPTSAAPASPTPTPSINGAGITLDVVNASGRDGAAKAVLDGLAAKGFTRGKASTGTATEASSLAYAAGDADRAKALATYLGGVTPREDTSLSAGTMVLTVGSGWTAPSGLGPTAAPASSPAPSGSAAAPVDATGGGVSGPPPTALTELQGSGIPCVK
ncbi:LCP family protein [Phycicoccus elongatus]|uniref:LCP family protein n=1 Tax=Phycicoccus elongatus TaxID=101689 RepID=UPI002C0CED77|nr:LCP family protein [Phycicoccus elongatus]HPF77219.1 LCP family protein [Phycicoccus elongatus]